MKIGIVGGTGSGKMTVAQILATYGFQIIDADRIGWEVIEEPGIKDRLVAEFGEGILKSGRIDRKVLGKIVFADKSKLDRLNQIVHPRLIERLKQELKRDNDLVLDCALLAQFSLSDELDYIILVRAPVELRKKRLIEKGLSEAEAEARIGSQDEYRGPFHFIIDNDAGIEKLKKECGRIMSEVGYDRCL
ncbi:dephospho-CoA kinase [candidate division WOR-3 bacterium]|uniref:Dephospho-CoA kinase n=1 Tax=candidate division WOR-3 bacterium TaxID=2052148 RepID=A0A660SI14_UNCW3|nr:MAG: dephospho-CoA kinase [candidate division WOR-3 bacterium]